MADLPTRLDLFALARDYIRQRATKLDVDLIDVTGSDINLFVGAISYLGHYLVRQIVSESSKLFLDSAQGDDLDRFAWDRYQLARKGASSAFGEATFYRDTLIGGSGTILKDTIISTSSGIEYVTLIDTIFALNEYTVTVPIRSVLAGVEQSASANEIIIIRSPGDLFDTSIKVYNEFATSHADDSETAEVFRERVRGFWTSARRGTLTAIEYGALQVPGIDSATAVEVITPNNDPARVVELYIADSQGHASKAIIPLVEKELLEWRALGIQVIIYPTSVQYVAVKIHPTFKLGIQTDVLLEQLKSALSQSVSELGAGETLLRSKLLSVIELFQSRGLVPTVNTLVSPIGDLVPDKGKTIRLRSSDVEIV